MLDQNNFDVFSHSLVTKSSQLSHLSPPYSSFAPKSNTHICIALCKRQRILKLFSHLRPTMAEVIPFADMESEAQRGQRTGLSLHS